MPNTHELTPAVAETWLRVAIENIQREYPHSEPMWVQGPEDYIRHREAHPTFFGSLDWHSCVEMYWVAVRLMRMFPGLPSERVATVVISSLLTAENIARERSFCERHPHFERPYGWGWLLKLQHELNIWDDERGRIWAGHLRPLADLFVQHYMVWLPKLTYPHRNGMHTNTAFALTLSWPYAVATAPELRQLIEEMGRTWFTDDSAYPFHYEPSGADFLSAGLTEAVMMQRVLSPHDFTAWVAVFLPRPGEKWLIPAFVSDPTDGHIAHLHGLNLSRAWALGELAAVLPDRSDELDAMRNRHIAASIDSVVGGHYMVEHWVVAYALLLHTEPV